MDWKNVKKTGKIYYTILTHGKDVKDMKKKLIDDLDKANRRVKDKYKKKIINDRLFPIIKLLENSYQDDDILNCIILSGNELEFFELSNEELEICKKWDLKNLYIAYDDKFKIGYLKNLFSEDNLNLIFQLTNDNLEIIEIDKVKSRTVFNQKIENQNNLIDIYNKDKPKIIHGTGSLLKKIKKNLDNIYLKKLSNEEIISIINKIEIDSAQKVLKIEVLDQINNPDFEDKFLFGKKEVSKGILEYMVKKLYTTPSLWRQLKKNTPNEYLNFKVLEIDKLENGDIGDNFMKDYSGIIALKYY